MNYSKFKEKLSEFYVIPKKYTYLGWYRSQFSNSTFTIYFPSEGKQ